MSIFAAAVSSYHGVPQLQRSSAQLREPWLSPAKPRLLPHGSCRTGAPQASAASLDRFDSLLQDGKVPQAVAVMEQESLDLTPARVSALIDAACELSKDTVLPPLPAAKPVPAKPDGKPTRRTFGEGGADANVDYQRRQQEELLSVYTSLASRGHLRGFGSVSATGLLPLSLDVRTVTPEDQLRLSGLATTSFAPPRGSSAGEIAAGTVSALLLTALSEALDGRLVFGAAAAGLLADQLLLRAAAGESKRAARALRPSWRRTEPCRERRGPEAAPACRSSAGRSLVDVEHSAPWPRRWRGGRDGEPRRPARLRAHGARARGGPLLGRLFVRPAHRGLPARRVDRGARMSLGRARTQDRRSGAGSATHALATPSGPGSAQDQRFAGAAGTVTVPSRPASPRRHHLH